MPITNEEVKSLCLEIRANNSEILKLRDEFLKVDKSRRLATARKATLSERHVLRDQCDEVTKKLEKFYDEQDSLQMRFDFVVDNEYVLELISEIEKQNEVHSKT